MNNINLLESLKSMTSIGSQETPLVSIFVPLRGTYLPITSIYTSLVRSANLILAREGKDKVLITPPIWKEWLATGARSLAIYHVDGMTTFLPMNIAMEPRVVVANSFHIKPLIASSHLSGTALLLTFHRQGCSLFKVSTAEALLHETYIPAKFEKDENWLDKIRRHDLREFLNYLQAEILSLSNDGIRFLAIDCPNDEIIRNENFWRQSKLSVKILQDRGLANSPDRSVGQVQEILEEEFTYCMSGIVYKVLAANQKRKRPTTKLEDLGRLILNKKITQLFVSLEEMHFGEFDQSTGKIMVHKGQQNSRDDDLLDDFAELAMQNEIEVLVVPRKFLPVGRSFIVA